MTVWLKENYSSTVSILWNWRRRLWKKKERNQLIKFSFPVQFEEQLNNLLGFVSEGGARGDRFSTKLTVDWGTVCAYKKFRFYENGIRQIYHKTCKVFSLLLLPFSTYARTTRGNVHKITNAREEEISFEMSSTCHASEGSLSYILSGVPSR